MGKEDYVQHYHPENEELDFLRLSAKSDAQMLGIFTAVFTPT